MLITAIILFLFAAALGLVVLIAILSDSPTPKPAVFTHGLIAITALFLVIIYMIMGHFQPLLITSIVLFIIAALGGLTLFTLDMKERPIPKLIALLHPFLALIALIILIIYILP